MGCPGSKAMSFDDTQADEGPVGSTASQLRQWPIQLHLISPLTPYYFNADVLLAADCTAFAMGNFHGEFLKGKSLAVACPKLDSGQEVYVDKIRGWIDEAGIKSLTVLIMQVPCCRGLLGLVSQAMKTATRKVPVKSVIVSLKGEVLGEEELSF